MNPCQHVLYSYIYSYNVIYSILVWKAAVSKTIKCNKWPWTTKTVIPVSFSGPG